jgi:hypothetical protein
VPSEEARMTKRSSFVIPPDLADVAAIVDMLDRSPQLLMQARPHAPIFAGRMHGASIAR